jgi:hypothetical protein
LAIVNNYKKLPVARKIALSSAPLPVEIARFRRRRKKFTGQ